MANSINTNISAYYAQSNIAKASTAATTSVSRLSSGNFITKASDDVARLSIGTSFSTTVRTLKQALVNAAQGVSLLQVADGALGQITEILQRQKTLSVQASSGNLSATDRGFLNQEFQALSQQIDFIASTSSFNGVKLLNGDLSSSSRIEDSVKKSVAASGTINLSEANNLVDGDVITINGLAFTARTNATISTNEATARQEFLIGTTSADTIANLAAKLTTLSSSNAATVSVPTATYAQRLGQNTYTNISGSSTLTVTARTGGTLGERFVINATGVASNKVSVGGNFGGASVNVFSTGVSTLTSATSSVVSSSPTATAPFKTGDALTLKLGSNPAVSLYTLAAGDSLTDIVKGINTTSLSTGVSASLVGDSTNGYNIKLNLSNVSSTASVAVGAGSNFYKPATGTAVIQTTSATSSVSLFNNTFASGVTSAGSTVISASSPSTEAAPFKSGDNLYASIDGGTYVAIAAIGTGETLNTLVDKINTNNTAIGLGIRAEVVAAGAGNNIRLTYLDTAQTGAISFYAGTAPTAGVQNSTTYATDTLGQQQNGPFGGSFNSFNLFAEGFTAPDLSLTDATASTATPFTAGTSVITLKINTSSTTSTTETYAVGSGHTLKDIITTINGDATSAAKGIHASLVTDAAGKYNIKITIAGSANPPAGASGDLTASPSGIQVSYSNSVLSTVNTTGTLNGTLSTAAYSSVNLFAVDLGSSVSGTSNLVGASAAAPLVTGANLVLDFPASGGNDAFSITIANGTSKTVNELVAAINADTTAVSKGITAAFVNAGLSTANIELRIADSKGTGAASPLTLTTNSAVGVRAASAQATAATTYVPPETNTQTTYRLFNSQFAATLTPGQSLVGATSTAATPFVNTQEISLKIGAGTAFQLTGTALATGDTLADIVTKINGLTATSGFTAELDGNGTNILLKRDTSVTNAQADTDIAAGANAYFYTSASGTTTASAIDNNATIGNTSTAAGVSARANLFNNNYFTNDVFNATFTAGSLAAAGALRLGYLNLSSGTALDTGGVTAEQPFNHSVTVGTNYSLSGDDGDVSTVRVRSSFNMSVGGITTASALTVDSTFIDTMNEDGYSYANLFGQDITGATGTTDLVGGTQAAPLIASNNLVISLGGGGNITIAIGADLTVNQLIGAINNNATAITNGVTAVLINSGTGTANIQLRVANTTGSNSTQTFSTNGTAGVLDASEITAAATAFSAPTLASRALSTTAGANTTLDDLVTQINADTNFRAAGIRAEVYSVGGGEYNIRFVAADAANTATTLTARTFGSITKTLAVTSGTGVDTGTDPTGVNNAGSFTATTATLATVTDQRLTLAKSYVGSSALDAKVTALQGNIGLRGGVDSGIGYGSVSVSGSVSSSLVTGLASKSAIVSMAFADTDDSAVTSAFSGKTLEVAGVTFTFATTPTSPTEIQIGSSLQKTIDNAVSALKTYAANNAAGDALYQLKQIDVARSGNNLVFTGKDISNVTKLDGTAASTIASNVSNVVVSNAGALSNATRSGTGTFGVDVSGVNNVDFSGKLQGFSATFNAVDTVTLSVKVGNNTYTATSVNTNPTVDGAGTDALGNQTIRFYSDTYTDENGREISGGFFDVQLAANQGRTVSDQAGANAYAAEVNAALQGLSFSQTRVISSYKAEGSIINASGTSIGSLVGSSVSAKLPTFDGNKLTTITVTPSTAANPDAEISLNIDGVKYTSRGVGSQLGANQTYKFISVSDPKNFVSFTTGKTAIDLSNAENASALEAALYTAFGVSEGSAALSFQIGTSSAESLGVSIGAASTDSLFNGETLSIATLEGAAAASDAIDAALGVVTSIRANVGALQSRFNFASANIQISVQNQDASRSELLDTDIAAESTSYATAQVQLQAGISVLAQANQQLQALLKLLG